MKKPIAIVVALIAILALCYLALQKRGSNEFADFNPNEELTLYCAAGIRKPISKIIDQYSAETGRKVNVIYNGSGALLSQIQLGKGDLYLPANISYVREAQNKNLASEFIPLAYLTAKIIVHKENTSIQSFEDLTKPGVRISFADESAAIGKFTRKVLKANGLFEKIEPNITVTKPTVNNIIEDVSLGSADATIAWDAVAKNFPELRTIDVPAFNAKKREACITLLNTSKNTSKALHLARYIAAKDKGLEIFKQSGFETVSTSDAWADVPELLIFSGSMLKPAIGDRILEFEKREGCRISTVYEGCGTLVSQMEAGAKPSFYFSCDQTFLDRVQDRFSSGTTVTKNEIVLLVPKGNPKQLSSLEKLVSQKAKVGIAHPTKSALGALTHQMLDNANLLKALQESSNIVLLASKGDELVTQMQANALDAALLYRSNAMATPSIMENCEIIALDRPDAVATQPYATAIDTPYPRQLERLGEFLTNADGKKNFLKHGFSWEKE
ncbi:molybdate ABC transporter substrate-binding protein [Rubritalea tangerina]|uniref:Molybdate ABC transporter substrate-binding protein n=1 Tax=Rubritalea tangerina TaxID=430798 RepID=A0ABW4ZDB8_9BACT